MSSQQAYRKLVRKCRAKSPEIPGKGGSRYAFYCSLPPHSNRIPHEACGLEGQRIATWEDGAYEITIYRRDP